MHYIVFQTFTTMVIFYKVTSHEQCLSYHESKFSFNQISIILRCNYANELRTMDSLRGDVRFCLARPHLGSGRNFSSWYPLVPIFAIRSSFFFSYFFSLLKSTFSLGPSLFLFSWFFSPPSCSVPSCFSGCPVLLDPFCFNLSERFWFRCFVLVSYPRSSIR